MADTQASALLRGARRRAKKKLVPFELELSHVVELMSSGRCQLTGLPLKSTGGTRSWDSPSLDRIIPALGYVPGNVRVVCFGINNALNTWGEEALEALVIHWLKQRGKHVTDIHLPPAEHSVLPEVPPTTRPRAKRRS